MLVKSGQFQSMLIVSLHTSRPIGRVTKLIIDPAQLQVLGFHVATEEGDKDKILLVQDVREIIPARIIIDSADEISDPDDLHRLRETLEMDFTLPGKPVVTESQQRLGTVDDFSVNLDTNEIAKIHVKPTLMKRMLGANFLIDRSQIIAVTDEEIIVDDALAADKQPVVAQA